MVGQVAYILFFVNVIKGEVLKKVREVRLKVKETTKLVAKNAGKKRGGGRRQLTDAEKKEEQEYLERMREKENMAASRRDRVQKVRLPVAVCPRGGSRGGGNVSLYPRRIVCYHAGEAQAPKEEPWRQHLWLVWRRQEEAASPAVESRDT